MKIIPTVKEKVTEVKNEMTFINIALRNLHLHKSNNKTKFSKFQ